MSMSRMKQMLKTFSPSITLLMVTLITSCTPDKTHDASVNFEFELSDAVAKVANLRVVTDVNGISEILTGYKSLSQKFMGSMKEDESGTFMIVGVFLTLKEDYKEEITKMTSSELLSFYNNCKFSSDLKVEIDKEPALNITQSDSYNGLPKDDKVTAETIIKSLEAHAASPEFSLPIFVLNIKKNGSKWSQIYAWNVWCEATVGQ